jgi:hypothetical protein
MFGGGSSEHPYNVTLSVSFENLLNHFNPGGYQCVITSPYFLQPTSINTGFGSPANNRRIQLDVRFSF